jgi:uncharacterized protein with HEPN domain
MSRDYSLYLRDILNATFKIKQFTTDIDEATFNEDSMRFDSVIFNLMVIGEATKNLTDEIRNLQPQLPWNKIVRFRDYVAHHYWGLNRTVIWNIVQEDIPAIQQAIQSILEFLDKTDT